MQKFRYFEVFVVCVLMSKVENFIGGFEKISVILNHIFHKYFIKEM